MDRRNILKGLVALGALALLPKVFLLGDNKKKRTRFVGIGDSGAAILKHIQKKDIDADFIFLHKQIQSSEMKRLFKEDDNYVLLTGLGGETGTQLTEKLLLLFQEMKKDFIVICSIPFVWEGELKRSRANRVKIKFQNLPNFNFFELSEIQNHYGHLKIREVLNIINEECYGVYMKKFRISEK